MGDGEHRVLTIAGACGEPMPAPCPQCPWRRSNDGIFPAEAFRLSARTALDMAEHVFGCHMTSRLCAGSVCGQHHNLALRRLQASGALDGVTDGGADLHPDYRSMAVANGVPADDPSLDGIR